MPDLNPIETTENQEPAASLLDRPKWGALWGGMFSFLAIWAVFGALGLGVFVSLANPEASQPIGAMNVGIGAWIIVLTTIAFFVAGRITGRLAHTQHSRDGAAYGLVMFGLTISAVFLVIAIGGTALGVLQLQGGVHSAYELGSFTYLGWMAFVALFFGWLAAMAGASSAHKELPSPRPAVLHHVRHA